MDFATKMTGQLPQQARADDIKELFGQFDGEAGRYQEIGRDSRAAMAEARWPILARLNIEQVSSAPPVPQLKPAFHFAAPQAVPTVQPPLATQRAPDHAVLFKRAEPMVAAEAHPDRSLSAIFKRLIGADPVPAPPKRSMLFNRDKT